METINSVAAAAAKAVWGENKEGNAAQGATESNASTATSSSVNNREEPVSGQLGDTNKGEPYDAGNKDENPPAGHSNLDSSGGDASVGASSSDGRATDSTSTGNVSSGAGSGDNTAANTSQSSGNTGSVADRTANPAQAKDSSHGAQDSTKGQNDVRDPEDPITHPETQEKRSNVNDAGEPQPDGPGPRPLTEVAKEHHGDAGKSNEDVDKSAGNDSSEHAPGPTGTDEEEGPNKRSTGEGTGEQYVKSSGFKADGGDFDASAPGAGREADRLLGEKGIHRDDPNKASGLSDAAGADSTSESHKRSLGDKIKEKLHRS